MTMVCPVCNAGKCNSKHVTHHFMKELLEAVASFENPLVCPSCDFRASANEGMAVHVAVGHAKLNLLLKDQDLVRMKRNQISSSRPNKITIGEICPVCDQQLAKQHSRTHVVWHFIEELREIVASFPNKNVSRNFLLLDDNEKTGLCFRFAIYVITATQTVTKSLDMLL